MTVTVNPYAPEAMADPFAFHNELRRRCPVAKVETPDFYIISGYRDVLDVLSDPARWTKSRGNLIATMEHNLALNQDPPAFNEFRRLYNGYMSPNGVRRWAPAATGIAEGLITSLLPLGAGDLQELLAKPLPVRVTAIAVGLPRENYDQYRAWTDAFLTAMANKPEDTASVVQSLYAFFDAEFDRRLAVLQAAGVTEPGPEHIGSVLTDDLIAVLMTARYQGRRLTREELRRTVRGFFIGGIDTTAALILNVLYRLLETRRLWDAVVADPGLVDAAIDESLRLDSPTIGMFRGAACPIEQHGVSIPQDARVFFSLPSANRDPDMFEDPDTFRLDRPPSERSRHLAFGSGAHFCPGAWLARMEARIAVGLVARHLPKLRLTGPVTRVEPFAFWGLTSFPAAWD